MSSNVERTEPTKPGEDTRSIMSPPAFLDLADSSTRLGRDLPDISARVELKRMEHERQRALHRQVFEQQMAALEQKQAEELLGLPVDPGLQHIALSAPTTPPRGAPQLNPERILKPSLAGPEGNRASYSEKRKSVTYSGLAQPPDEIVETGNRLPHNRSAGAKSMPGSRRPSTGSHASEELEQLVEGLSVHDRAPGSARHISRLGNLTLSERRMLSEHNPVLVDSGYHSHLNAGHMLDEQLDQEMQSAMLHLPISDEDKLEHSRIGSYSKLSTASAALDLAPLAQTPPRGFVLARNVENAKSSEWPQYAEANPRGTTRLPSNSAIGSSRPSHKLAGASSATATPNTHQHTSELSRRSSPQEGIDGISSAGVPRSMPMTPLASRNLDGSSVHKGSRTSGLPGSAAYNSFAAETYKSPPSDLSDSMPRLGHALDAPLTFNSIRSSDDTAVQFGSSDNIYGLSGIGDSRFSSYPSDAQSRISSGSTALYNYGSRFGLNIGGPRPSGGQTPDSKMNGLHGPKHKRAEVDRAYRSPSSIPPQTDLPDNRFTGTRLEDLQGEIAALCKDQHGCRFLQKKLEEGAPEHRDMIFRETYGHFPELMTDPFGNYLCQKLLEYSTDEQRTVICDSVAQDLVNISLNMHGTRAVQKMIDFLSIQRQADIRYDAQIRSIIVALSLHVVILIKDLNGNHVIQKCLNKLTPEDNQFIYNAVAANCVEVATHRHGCCVLQRCIDHASDSQRVQLVNEITFNALTLVQDPYGNYVVQYILDLNDNRFSDAVIRQFTGNVCALSVQKFSSNVIEKCVRVAEIGTRKLLIDEMLHRSRLEKLLRDSYGNYCVQTALDYAEPSQRSMLVDGIRPILPLIRNTPYGKRIQSKLQREQVESANGHFGSYQQPNGGLMGNHGYNHHNIGRGTGSMRNSGDMHGSVYGSSLHQVNHSQSLHSRLHQQSSLMDPYAYQNGRGLGHPMHGASFGAFTNTSSMSGFDHGASLTHSDIYSRSTFPYGM